MFRYFAPPLPPQVISQEGGGRDKVTAGVQLREGGSKVKYNPTVLLQQFRPWGWGYEAPGGGGMKPLGVGVWRRGGKGMQPLGWGIEGGGGWGWGGEMKLDLARVGWVLGRWMLG